MFLPLKNTMKISLKIQSHLKTFVIYCLLNHINIFGLMSHCTTNMFFSAHQLMLLQGIVIHKTYILKRKSKNVSLFSLSRNIKAYQALRLGCLGCSKDHLALPNRREGGTSFKK